MKSTITVSTITSTNYVEIENKGQSKLSNNNIWLYIVFVVIICLLFCCIGELLIIRKRYYLKKTDHKTNQSMMMKATSPKKPKLIVVESVSIYNNKSEIRLKSSMNNKSHDNDDIFVQEDNSESESSNLDGDTRQTIQTRKTQSDEKGEEAKTESIDEYIEHDHNINKMPTLYINKTTPGPAEGDGDV